MTNYNTAASLSADDRGDSGNIKYCQKIYLI